MSDVIFLKRGGARATINPLGGWLERLSIDGNDVLFPKSTLENAAGERKVRGGCHICLPNFGPDATGNLSQHGFARESQWDVFGEHTSGHISLGLHVTEGEYSGLRALLNVRLTTSGMSLGLSIENQGQNVLSIAPAFHPYFVSHGKEGDIDGTSYSMDSLEEAQILNGAPRLVILDGQQFALQATNLATWILWSDRLAGYVCIEPTQSGFSFAEAPPSKAAVQLKPTQSWNCSMTIEKIQTKEKIK